MNENQTNEALDQVIKAPNQKLSPEDIQFNTDKAELEAMDLSASGFEGDKPFPTIDVFPHDSRNDFPVLDITDTYDARNLDTRPISIKEVKEKATLQIVNNVYSNYAKVGVATLAARAIGTATKIPFLGDALASIAGGSSIYGLANAAYDDAYTSANNTDSHRQFIIDKFYEEKEFEEKSDFNRGLSQAQSLGTLDEKYMKGTMTEMAGNMVGSLINDVLFQKMAGDSFIAGMGINSALIDYNTRVRMDEDQETAIKGAMIHGAANSVGGALFMKTMPYLVKIMGTKYLNSGVNTGLSNILKGSGKTIEQQVENLTTTIRPLTTGIEMTGWTASSGRIENLALKHLAGMPEKDNEMGIMDYAMTFGVGGVFGLALNSPSYAMKALGRKNANKKAGQIYNEIEEKLTSFNRKKVNLEDDIAIAEGTLPKSKLDIIDLSLKENVEAKIKQEITDGGYNRFTGKDATVGHVIKELPTPENIKKFGKSIAPNIKRSNNIKNNADTHKLINAIVNHANTHNITSKDDMLSLVKNSLNMNAGRMGTVYKNKTIVQLLNAVNAKIRNSKGSLDSTLKQYEFTKEQIKGTFKINTEYKKIIRNRSQEQNISYKDSLIIQLDDITRGGIVFDDSFVNVLLRQFIN